MQIPPAMQEKFDREWPILRSLYPGKDLETISCSPALADCQHLDWVEWSLLPFVQIEPMQIFAEARSVLILHPIREERKQFARHILLLEIRKTVEGQKTTF